MGPAAWQVGPRRWKVLRMRPSLGVFPGRSGGCGDGVWEEGWSWSCRVSGHEGRVGALQAVPVPLPTGRLQGLWGGVSGSGLAFPSHFQTSQPLSVICCITSPGGCPCLFALSHSCSVAWADLLLEILLTQPPKCWSPRCVPPHRPGSGALVIHQQPPGLDGLCTWLLSQGDGFQWEWSMGTPRLAPVPFQVHRPCTVLQRLPFNLRHSPQPLWCWDDRYVPPWTA